MISITTEKGNIRIPTGCICLVTGENAPEFVGLLGGLCDKEDTVKINGYDTKKQRRSAFSQVGLLSTDTTLPENLTVEEYLLWLAKSRMNEGEKAVQNVRNLLNQGRLDAVRHTLCRDLSQYTALCTAVAGALAGNTNVLVMENIFPTDTPRRDFLWEWLTENRDRRTLIFSGLPTAFAKDVDMTVLCTDTFEMVEGYAEVDEPVEPVEPDETIETVENKEGEQ